MATGRASKPVARDRLGRPVPPTSADRVDPGIDVDAVRAPRESARAAQELLASGFPFAAHEVFEAQWKRCPANERDLWQGLAQWCVAITHAARGNHKGAERLRERALSHLTATEAVAASRRLALDLDAVTHWLRAPGSGLPSVVVAANREVPDPQNGGPTSA